MTTTAKPAGSKTIADWLAQPEELRLELIDGEFVQKAVPDEPHADTQAAVIGILRPEFNRRGGSGHAGGWWIRSEIEIKLGSLGFRPDVAGWRRDRVPAMPKERPISIPLDWIGEILSASNATTDIVRKLRRYHQAAVAHYWILDPQTQTLTMYRNTPDGYLNVLVAEKGERVRAEPFDEIELRVGLLFGEDPDDPPEKV